MPLIYLLLALIVMAIVSVGIYRHEAVINEQKQAAMLGHQIADYMNASEERMTVDHTLKAGTYIGSAWLKNKACGGVADKNYVPCHFKVQSRLLNRPVEIVISQNEDDQNKYDATLIIGPFGLIRNGQYQLRPALAGATITAAKTYFIENTNQFISASSTYALDRKKALATINIVANQINGNVFVRRDGSVDMENHLVFDSDVPDIQRQLEHVSLIQMDGKQSEITASQSLSLAAANNDIKQGLSGTYINEMAQSGNVFLGNQSGTKGKSNVVVNDLTIHSMNDQKLTDLLKQGKNILSGFTGSKSISFSAVTGESGSALITVYGGFVDHGFEENAHLTLYRNGTPLRQVQVSAFSAPEWHDKLHSSAEPFFQHVISGQKAFSKVGGLSAIMSANAGSNYYVGYSVIPF